MKKLSLYEPAMCCDTGLCGVGVDPELLRISTVLNMLKKQGVPVERFNLTSAPMAFIQQKSVNAHLQAKGVEGLPAIVLENEIVLFGRYPTNDEIVEWLDLPTDALSQIASTEATCGSDAECCADEGCCGSDDKPAKDGGCGCGCSCSVGSCC